MNMNFQALGMNVSNFFFKVFDFKSKGIVLDHTAITYAMHVHVLWYF